MARPIEPPDFWADGARLVVMCACGGLLKADQSKWWEVETAVKRHRRTYRHLDWWSKTKAEWCG